MKIAVVLGTRPNFIKQYSFHRACESRGIETFTIHTGQHYDAVMFDVFFKELNIPPPDYVHDLDRTTPAHELSDMLVYIEGVLAQERPDVTVVFGDVTSTMAGAQASAMLGIPVAHVESGVRTPNLYNREEINRRVAEALADTLFPHIRDSFDQLKREGVPDERLCLTGDLVKDSLDLVMAENGISSTNGDYVYVSFHRAENTDDKARLKAISDAIMKAGKAVKFPVHPRTRRALDRFDLLRDLQRCDHVELLPPLGFVENTRVLAAAERVLSDSGGVRREAYILGKPVVSLIGLVWVPSMVRAGWEFIADADPDKIRHGLNDFMPPAERPEIFGDGHAADRIADELLKRYQLGESRAAATKVGLRNNESMTALRILDSRSKSTVARRGKDLRPIVSVVIPCYNEEEGLPTLFYRMSSLQKLVDSDRYRLEFVITDDGSTDETWSLLTEVHGTSPNVRLVRHEINLGYGAALKTAINTASGDVIVTIDADTNYDVRETPRLLEALEDGTAFVTGSPFMDSGNWNYPMHRFVMSRGLVTLYRLVLGRESGDIRTMTCCFRAMRRECVPKVMPDADDFLATAEILVRALLAGLKVKQIPMTIEPRLYGRSKLRTLRMIFRHLGFMWRILRNQVAQHPDAEQSASAQHSR